VHTALPKMLTLPANLLHLLGARPDLPPSALVVWGVAGAFRLNRWFLGAKFINPDIKIISVFETVLMIIGIYTLGIKTLEHE